MTATPPPQAAPDAVTRPLFMTHLPIDGRRLFAFARDHGGAKADGGYVVHALLAALFGAEAPHPFALPGDGSGGGGGSGSGGGGGGGFGSGHCAPLSVLAYGHHALATLRDRAQTLASPAVYQAVDWDEAASKPMPSRFSCGQILGFEVRACPVVRIGRGNPHLKEAHSEVDAVIAAHLAAKDGRAPAPESHEAVYRDWLIARMTASGAVMPRDVQVIAQRLTHLFRRGARPEPQALKARPFKQCQRPDVRFRGRLEITDPQAFHHWLARGLGRHRAFGFGMVLLRPA